MDMPRDLHQEWWDLRYWLAMNDAVLDLHKIGVAAGLKPDQAKSMLVHRPSRSAASRFEPTEARLDAVLRVVMNPPFCYKPTTHEKASEPAEAFSKD